MVKNADAGIYFDGTNGGTLTVANSILSENLWGVNVTGGGATITACSISENTNEGVLLQVGSYMAITGATISDNPLGGIDNEGSGLTLNDSTIANNGQQATNGGGILNSGDMLVNDSTIVDNSASVQGGGIDTSSGNATLNNTIVAGNTNATAPDIVGNFTASYCLIGDNTGSGLTAAPLGTPDANGNLIGDSTNPIDALLAPLASYGGPTLPDGSSVETMPLETGSPAVGAGSSALASASGATSDQRGVAWNLSGSTVDIGACQFQCIVTGISPTMGSLAGGTTVTIMGIGLSGVTAVNFGGTAATNLAVASDTQITATSPAGKLGPVDVTVVTPSGTSATSQADQFIYDFPTTTATVATPATAERQCGACLQLARSHVGPVQHPGPIHYGRRQHMVRRNDRFWRRRHFEP